MENVRYMHTGSALLFHALLTASYGVWSLLSVIKINLTYNYSPYNNVKSDDSGDWSTETTNKGWEVRSQMSVYI